MPDQTPALKMSPINSQLVKAVQNKAIIDNGI